MSLIFKFIRRLGRKNMGKVISFKESSILRIFYWNWSQIMIELWRLGELQIIKGKDPMVKIVMIHFRIKTWQYKTPSTSSKTPSSSGWASTSAKKEQTIYQNRKGEWSWLCFRKTSLIFHQWKISETGLFERKWMRLISRAFGGMKKPNSLS